MILRLDTSEGIVLISFPFTDLTAAKLRPALVLFEGERDVVVAFISSRVPQSPMPTDIIVDREHPEFELTGLKVASAIKLDKVVTISKDLILGEIGEIGNKLKEEINAKLSKALSSRSSESGKAGFKVAYQRSYPTDGKHKKYSGIYKERHLALDYQSSSTKEEFSGAVKRE